MNKYKIDEGTPLTVVGFPLTIDIPQYEIDYFKTYDYTSASTMLEFKDGSKCPKNYFFWKDYVEVWKPCYGKFKPEDCKSFEEFKDKLAVAQL